MAHTKGKWRATIYPGKFDQPLILSESGKDVIARVHSLPERQHEANAKLIAAAPDLLEALKLLVSFIEVDGFEVPEIAIKAIKKATE